MLCSFGDSHNISAEWISIRLPLTMLMQCVIQCVRVCVCLHVYVCFLADALLCRQLERISSDVVPSKKLLFKHEALRCLFGWTLLLLAPVQEVELTTLSSQAQRFMSLVRGLAAYGAVNMSVKTFLHLHLPIHNMALGFCCHFRTYI